MCLLDRSGLHVYEASVPEKKKKKTHFPNQQTPHQKAHPPAAVTLHPIVFSITWLTCTWHITPQCTKGDVLDCNKFKVCEKLCSVHFEEDIFSVILWHSPYSSPGNKGCYSVMFVKSWAHIDPQISRILATQTMFLLLLILTLVKNNCFIIWPSKLFWNMNLFVFYNESLWQ